MKDFPITLKINLFSDCLMNSVNKKYIIASNNPFFLIYYFGYLIFVKDINSASIILFI